MRTRNVPEDDLAGVGVSSLSVDGVVARHLAMRLDDWSTLTRSKVGSSSAAVRALGYKRARSSVRGVIRSLGVRPLPYANVPANITALTSHPRASSYASPSEAAP